MIQYTDTKLNVRKEQGERVIATELHWNELAMKFLTKCKNNKKCAVIIYMCFAYLLSEAMTINFPIICHGGCFSTIIIQTSIIICRMFGCVGCYMSVGPRFFFASFSFSLGDGVCIEFVLAHEM